MCANTVSFQNNAWNGHKCSGFQPVLNWIFPRGDTSIFSKKLASFYLQKWGYGEVWNRPDTVLPQKKHTHRMLYNFASSPQITLVFTHEPRYINKFFWKKKLGRTPQNKPPFPRFFEKIGNTKNTFFPSWQKFRTSIFEKRPKIVDFWGPRPRNFFWTNFR